MSQNTFRSGPAKRRSQSEGDEHLKPEVERRFLISPSNLPQLGALECIRCRSGYLRDINGENIVRFRKEKRTKTNNSQAEHLGTRFFATMKFGEGLYRMEAEFEMSESKFDAQWHLLESLIHKQRYLIPYDGLTIELDIFEKQLAGLIIAEVEIPLDPDCNPGVTGELLQRDLLERANGLVIPAWFGPEVTDDERFTGHNLGKLKSVAELNLSSYF